MVQNEGRLYLVFEFVDMDLKKYFESCQGPLSPQLIRVFVSPKTVFVISLNMIFDDNSLILASCCVA